MIILHGDACRRLPFNSPEERPAYTVPGSDGVLDAYACIQQVLAEDWDGTLPCCPPEDDPPPGTSAPPPMTGEQIA